MGGTGRIDRRIHVVTAIVLAVAVVAWHQLWHRVGFAGHGSHAGWGHLVRDTALALPVAYLAVVFGLRWAAHRPVTDASSAALVKSVAVAVLFAVLLVPTVAVHSLIDDALEDDAIRPAPGTAYLIEDSLEDDRSFLGLATHGLRDAAIALPAAFLAVAVVFGLVARRPARQARAVGPAEPRIRPDAREADMRAPGSLTKRELFRLAGGAAAAAAVSSSGLIVLATRQAHAASPSASTPWLTDRTELFMRDGIYETIEGRPVFMYGWGWSAGGIDRSDDFLTPGPVLWSHEGETIEVTITNTRNAPHAFVIEGVIDSGPIAPGDTVDLAFPAPPAGTYVYADTSNGPVNRVLGLHGVLVVMPGDGTMRSNVDLDLTHWAFETQWVWVFNQIDPAWNDRAQAGLSIDPDAFITGFLPRYFTINGRMGSLAAHEETAPDTVVADRVGNPALIRIVNAGVATHGPHFHGNHVYPVAVNGDVPPVIMWKDTIMVRPADRVDIHLPFNIPPNAVHFPPPPEGTALLAELHGQSTEGTWPMHCHVEMSQTAAGGLYPQGLLTDWKQKP